MFHIFISFKNVYHVLLISVNWIWHENDNTQCSAMHVMQWK